MESSTRQNRNTSYVGEAADSTPNTPDISSEPTSANFRPQMSEARPNAKAPMSMPEAPSVPMSALRPLGRWKRLPMWWMRKPTLSCWMPHVISASPQMSRMRHCGARRAQLHARTHEHREGHTHT